MLYVDEIMLNETKVILKPEYRSMAKNFWLYPEKWRNQDDVKGENLVLGGEYSVWKIEDRSIYLSDKYRKFELPNTVGVHDLVLAEEVSSCKFKAGDLVKLCKDFEFDSFRVELKSNFDFYFGRLDFSERYIVTDILNKHYIFINVSKDSDNAFPFYCNDFE